MANPGPAIAGIPNTELFLSTGPLSRMIYPVGFTNGGAFGNGTLSFNYVPVTAAVSGSRLDGLFNIAVATSATANTGALVYTAMAGIYTALTSAPTRWATSLTRSHARRHPARHTMALPRLRDCRAGLDHLSPWPCVDARRA